MTSLIVPVVTDTSSIHLKKMLQRGSNHGPLDFEPAMNISFTRKFFLSILGHIPTWYTWNLRKIYHDELYYREGSIIANAVIESTVNEIINNLVFCLVLVWIYTVSSVWITHKIEKSIKTVTSSFSLKFHQKKATRMI